jgi:hypothetical protein
MIKTTIAITASTMALMVPASAITTPVPKVVHHRTTLPTCKYEDGSSQLACLSGPQEGVKYVAVVISRKASPKGWVWRAYLYTDKNNKVTKVERVWEKF